MTREQFEKWYSDEVQLPDPRLHQCAWQAWMASRKAAAEVRKEANRYHRNTRMSNTLLGIAARLESDE